MQTVLGGTPMPPAVIAAWVNVCRDFVILLRQPVQVGERTARVVGVQAALDIRGPLGPCCWGDRGAA
jgi:hypothetical protein